jgi:DNA-binding transcriptional LysR family regulator
MNRDNFDINLLRVFSALFSEQNVTRAAQKVGLAQSSMSNALSRLRYAFDDDLFVRTPKGMLPTDRAKMLKPHVDLALNQVSMIFDVAQPFEPELATGKINIATSDNINLFLAPKLSALLQDRSPNLSVHFGSLSKATIIKELDDGKVDLAIGSYLDLPKRFNRQQLYKDSFVCIARKNHPSLEGGMTIEAFTEIPHVLMTLNNDMTGIVDSLLAREGLKRRVALSIDQFTVLPYIVANTDYLAVCPASLSKSLVNSSNCDIFELPLEQDKWEVLMVWSNLKGSEPANSWVRGLINASIET